ncbi:CRISPR-associated protein [Corynebacterium diphtheriae]|uniref:CRISPR-associated protein n=1 Tax=Corynebacterium diphtheriae TaxID=1717 RepID=UPI001F53D0BF|nr:CRISPR-associated protein [Corynebacterium diphtheriae]
MKANAFSDIAWIRTTAGLVTPKEALSRCHEPGFSLDMSLPGFEISAQFRFLLSVTALLVREEFGRAPSLGQTQSLLQNGFSSAVVEKVNQNLVSHLNVLDGLQPFMGRPRLHPEGPKDASRRIGPGDQEVKKLSPAMPSEQGEDYWNLLVEFPDSLSISEATLKIVTYHYFSMAGNNKFDGDKTRMGAPGIRFPGKGYAATEHIWIREGSSLLRSLLTSLPTSWVKGEGLPAWADRTAQKSRTGQQQFHALWEATWSSNTVVSYWEDGYLTGVRVGGIPPAWWPDIPNTKEGEKALKLWWDQRNEKDPLYFYLKNKKGEPKAQRIDFGRDGIDLAVEWAAEAKMMDLVEKTYKNVLPVDSYPTVDGDDEGIDKYQLVFFRHQVEGTASSPSIRASEVFLADRSVWAFDLSCDEQLRLRDNAQLVRDVYITFLGVFRRKSAADASREVATGWGAAVLDSLAVSQSDASDAYWRGVTDVYQKYLADLRVGEEITEELYRGIRSAALEAYDEVTAPYLAQYANEIYYVRASLVRSVNSKINTARDEGIGRIKEESNE